MASADPTIVICGAGIAGVAAAYHLAVVHGCKNVILVEEGNPLSLTSDKSTEAYRNWWPGPEPSMTAFMNASIDQIEKIAHDSGNRINLNRRGYLFASADAGKVDWLHEMAMKAEAQGAGTARVHDRHASTYRATSSYQDTMLTGVDLITDGALIRAQFPYLSPDTKVVAHARRAGWLSAQQLGAFMLEAAREKGVRLMRGRVDGIDAPGGRLAVVHVDTGQERRKIEAAYLVLAAGPPLVDLAKRLAIDLPLFAERHFKISFLDTDGIVPRTAPMMIWLDEQRLPWSEEERQVLREDDATRWLTDPFPAGVHGRPDGEGARTSLLILFNYENVPTDVVFPLPEPEHYGEIALRGMTTMVPGLQVYVDRGVRPFVDGGYYVKTRENRPLIGPTAVEGVLVSGGYSGFGIMASCAGGDLIARQILELPLPPYAPAFQLSRYADPAYNALLATWGDGSQL